MTELEQHSAYRSIGGYWLIELKLHEVRELFNTLDPAPFRKKDLDAQAEEYIVGAVRELGTQRSAKLMVYVPDAEMANAKQQDVVAAIHNYFAYRTRHAALELRQLLARGVVSLVIGLAFLMLCLSLRRVPAAWSGTTSIVPIEEGLLILGWVAMWRPMEIFLYDWWPLWRQQRLLRRIADMPVELGPLPEAESAEAAR